MSFSRELLHAPQKLPITHSESTSTATMTQQASETQQPQPQPQESESCANVFNSLDFGKFLSNELPKDMAGSNLFLSKDHSLPSFDVPSVFKSKDTFSKMFMSSDWEMRFPTKAAPEAPDVPPTKTMQSLVTVPTVTPVTSQRESLRNFLSSKEWMPMNTLGSYRDVPIHSEMFGGATSDSDVSTPNDAELPSELPPARTDWDNVFMSQLQLLPPPPSPAPDLASVPQEVPSSDGVLPELEEEQMVTLSEQSSPAAILPSSLVPSTTTRPTKKKRKRKPRKKVIPEVKIYVEPKESDVLLGRGGRSNHHPGNKRYREEVTNLQTWYAGIAQKDEKTDLSQCLVDYVHSYQGRFLEKDNTDWYEVPNIVARRKASQALREDNDPEKRAAKRARFLTKKADMQRFPKPQNA